MSLWPKKHFGWAEPKSFLQRRDVAEREKLRWWHKPLAVLILAALGLTDWYAARFIPGKHPVSFREALCLTLAFGVLFGYAAPWMVSRCSSKVSLMDKSLTRVRGNTHRQIKYSAMESFVWRTEEDVFLLEITERRNGRKIVFGVPTDVPVAEVNQFLIDRQVRPWSLESGCGPSVS